MNINLPNSKTIFANNLCYFLKINHKKQADLAKYMEVSSGLVSDWCSGKKLPRVDKIQSMSNWFGIELSDLLEDKREQQNNRFYEKDEIERIALAISNNADLHTLFILCEKMKPEKLKSLLDFVRFSA